MSKSTIVILALLGLGAAGALAFRGFRSAPDNRMRISGNIELTQVNIAFKVSGKLIERAVDEGDTVKKGMIVARLDKDQLLRQRDREQAALAEAQSQLSHAGTTVEWTQPSRASTPDE